MKNILLFAICLFFFEITSNAQGLKDVELGDYGLTAPLWGKDKIETTLLGCKGTLDVKKYNNKIYRIVFTFSNNLDFTQEMADNLANSLMKKYTNIKFTRDGGCDWIQSPLRDDWKQHELSDEKKVEVFVMPAYIGCDTNNPHYLSSKTAEVYFRDVETFIKMCEEEEEKIKKDNSDF